MSTLLPHHREHLRASGLDDATIEEHGIHSVTEHRQAASLLNVSKLQPRSMLPAIVFPFKKLDGRNGYARLRPDNPRTDARSGERIKYESPRKAPNEIYFPRQVREIADKPEEFLLVTEGEKKALKASQEGFPCIGLVGVYGWKAKDRESLLPDLELVEWKGRRVFIVFDSDRVRNEHVIEAESRLAAQLKNRGAIVKIVHLPDGPNGQKFGLDDFLVANPPPELHKLLNAATDSEAPRSGSCLSPAKELDSASEGKRIIELLKLDDVSRLRFHRDSFWMWQKPVAKYVEIPKSEIAGETTLQLNKRYFGLRSSHVADVVMQLRAQALLSSSIESPAWLANPKPWPAKEVLATRNALVHLPSYADGIAHTVAPTPRFFSTHALEFDFDPNASEPHAWLSFLNDLWQDDPESIETLQQWFGYCLTVDTSQQKMLVLIGPKRGGKGTIARVLRALVGPANVVGPTLSGLATNFGLWPLVGKSLAIIGDARLGGKADQQVIVERILSITGEDTLTIDRKNLEPITGPLRTRLVLVSNELPKLTDSSGALVSRMIVLRSERSFLGCEDTGLMAKLSADLPGILRWAIRGWQSLRDRGHFTQPKSAEELLEDMNDLASPVSAFVRDVCEVKAGRSEEVSVLFRAWEGWCARNGRKSGTAQTFGRDLLAAYPKLRRTQPRDERGGRIREYEGIGLKLNTF